MTNPCAIYPLIPPRVVAIAKDNYLNPTNPFPDPVFLPGTPAPRYGPDITFGTGRNSPGGKTAGSSVAELKSKMRRLLSEFAAGDNNGKARRLFNEFLSKNGRVKYFDDVGLTSAAANHPHIQEFCHRALSAPTSAHQSRGETRIHQALRNANWDITRIQVPTDLGVPAFNGGSPYWQSGDFDNGLGLMINGVQYVYVLATHYYYDRANNKYCLSLRFVFYDVFGLDDDDVREYGASSDDWFPSDAGLGITAWWQLQHQYNFAPLVTRFRLGGNYEVPTA